jgi:hypothetical protein
MSRGREGMPTWAAVLVVAAMMGLTALAGLAYRNCQGSRGGTWCDLLVLVVQPLPTAASGLGLGLRGQNDP